MGAAAVQRPVVEKPPILAALDVLFSSASKKELKEIRQELQSGAPLLDWYNRLRPPKASDATDRRCIKQSWFAPNGYWNTKPPVQEQLRKGILAAIDMQLRYGAKGPSGRPLPVDYWWVQGAIAFEVVPSLSKTRKTIVVLVLTPQPRRLSKG